jgi:hypothetical protein
MRVKGIITIVRRSGIRERILLLICPSKNRNSYRVIMIGKVKAISFVFMARMAERRETA